MPGHTGHFMQRKPSHSVDLTVTAPRQSQSFDIRRGRVRLKFPLMLLAHGASASRRGLLFFGVDEWKES